ncbi:hypothetical protein OBBRIDRAFT_49980 [Obba rivulosa]|uniref:DUF6535 domain-containing protein n=1 Tax=Obba rivulosa TaxID=1052685 RepID=A0A8E2J4Y5_9APHY|nr:hypothetical protein OBBRIDRAFT_49980 [Obba rivulosa]
MSQGHSDDYIGVEGQTLPRLSQTRDSNHQRTESPHTRPTSMHLGDTPKSGIEDLGNDTDETIDEASVRCACPHPWNYLRTAKPEEHDATEAGWASCDRQLRDHDRDLAQAWKEEIDTLLVFAGLFSAILTAFNVELYTSLAPDPGVDLTNRILVQISTQLAGLSMNDPSATSVQPTFLSSHPTKASTPSVWINALWFSSLVLSLSSAAIGIIVRQWLGHFISPTSSNAQRSAQIHCLRYDRGLVSWHVPEILSLLPILLLASLVLFLIGLVILLWTLNGIVAGITTGLVAVLFLFLVSSTVLPTIRLDCPYKSPQALLFHWCWQRIRSTFLARLIRKLCGQRQAVPRNLPYIPDMSIFADAGPSLCERFGHALGVASGGRIQIWVQSFAKAIRSIVTCFSTMELEGSGAGSVGQWNRCELDAKSGSP